MFITRLCFTNSKCDSSLFIYRQCAHVTYLLLYVDDITLAGSSSPLLTTITSVLGFEFDMTHLDDLHYFLGISNKRIVDRLLFSQQKYANNILDCASMANCKPTSTPADLSIKLDGSGPPVDDLTLYLSPDGALQYLTFTRPNITYVVQ